LRGAFQEAGKKRGGDFIRKQKRKVDWVIKKATTAKTNRRKARTGRQKKKRKASDPQRSGERDYPITSCKKGARVQRLGGGRCREIILNKKQRKDIGGTQKVSKKKNSPQRGVGKGKGRGDIFVWTEKEDRTV